MCSKIIIMCSNHYYVFNNSDYVSEIIIMCLKILIMCLKSLLRVSNHYYMFKNLGLCVGDYIVTCFDKYALNTTDTTQMVSFNAFVHNMRK